MNIRDLFAVLPLLLIAASAVVVMLSIAAKRSPALAAGLTIGGLTAAFVSLWAAASAAPRQVTPLLLVDRYALFYTGLIVGSAAVAAVLAYQYFKSHEGEREELYLLVLLATLGCAVLVASSHFASFILGLEVLSVSLYGMLAYLTDRKRALEAGVKYLILASASAAFLLFGMALIYAATGTMQFSQLRDLSPRGSELTLLFGIALTVTGIGFKLGVVPFHLWTPDVYQGASPPVAAFVATTSKSAMVALLLRYFYLLGALRNHAIFVVFVTIAVLSMCAGNFLALRQTNVQRILAYSSIAHFGYILVAFLAGSTMAVEAVAFYLVAYTVTLLAAFGVVSVLSNSGQDAGDLEDYRGLFWRRPAIACVFTAALLSLAGIPATMGFLGKFYVLAAGANAAAWALMIVLVVTSVAGLFYYLRIVVALYAEPIESGAQLQLVPWSGVAVLVVLGALLLWFGMYPTPLLDLIRSTVMLSS
ncbi:MAG TPA: NADH-quinone oxidoreductase subunit N [Bryobacteraceae bacterium]|nr:NADH-quinone oxidoreductase subunit N [Bryobacteraceae bacterium]